MKAGLSYINLPISYLTRRTKTQIVGQMNRQMIILTVSVIALLAGSGMAYGQANVTAQAPPAYKLISNYSLLNYSYTAINCRTAFIATEVNDSVAAVNGISYITNNLTVLRTENAHLLTYVAAGNVIGFSTYLHGIYDPSYNSMFVITRNALKSFNSISNSTRQSLTTKFTAARATFTNCTSGSVTNIADAKLAAWNKSIAEFDSQIKSLSILGVNTANMSSTVQGGQSAIITPFQSAIATNNQTKILAALNGYCLFDGCKNGTNYHLDAKFNIAKLYAIDARLANSTNDTTDLNGALVDINNASAELAAVGTSQYTKSSSQQIWNNISAAGSLLLKAFRHLIRKR